MDVILITHNKGAAARKFSHCSLPLFLAIGFCRVRVVPVERNNGITGDRTRACFRAWCLCILILILFLALLAFFLFIYFSLIAYP